MPSSSMLPRCGRVQSNFIAKSREKNKSHSKPIKNPVGVEFHIQPPSTPRFKTGLTGPFCTKVEAADTAQPEA